MLLKRAQAGEAWEMIVEGMVLMRSSRGLAWERRCGQGPGVGMQEVVWINATGVTSGLGDGREINGKEKQESGQMLVLY